MTGPSILISTSMGDITIQLDSVRAPKSVANLLRYVREKHYDNTAFYRVAKGFVIQMGSFDANGKGRGIHPGPVPLEANNGLTNLRGTVAFGRAEAPDSATAEFFINLADNTPLDHKADDPGNTTGYAVFGQVKSGMEVAEAISDVPTGGGKGPMPVGPGDADHREEGDAAQVEARHKPRSAAPFLSPVRMAYSASGVLAARNFRRSPCRATGAILALRP